MRFLVNVDVDDLERATRFYTGAFGLRPGRRFGADAGSRCWPTRSVTACV